MFILLTQNPNTRTSTRLIKEAKRLKLETKILNPFQGLISFNSSNPSRDIASNHSNEGAFGLHRSSGVSFDDFDLLYSENLIREGATIENHPRVLKNFRDKEKQALFFFENKIPQIPTLSFRGAPSPSLLNEVDDFFFPYLENETFILKTNRGNKGLGVNIVRGKDSLFSFLETFWAIKDQRFVLQPYIHGVEEFRVFLLKDECLGGVLKPKPFDFRKNSERSFSSPQYFNTKSLPKEVLEFSHRTFENSGAFYLGLDFLITSEGPLIIEMNCSPGFEQFEKFSGINIAREIILKLRGTPA